MSHIIVNDIFDDLKDENKRLNECLNVLIRFKTFIDLISDKIKTTLESNVVQMFDDFNKEVKEVFNKYENINKNKTQTKETSNDTKPDINQLIRISEVIINRKTSSKAYGRGRRLHKSPEEGIQSEEKSFICDFVGCGKAFAKKAYLSEHKKSHTSKKRRFRCDFDGCPFSTITKYELVDHINAHKGIKAYACQECDKRMASRKSLKRHVAVYHKLLDQTLVCDINGCGKEFRSELSFKVHRNYHLADRPYACDHQNCDFRAVNHCLLRQHIDRVHAKHRPFKCDVEGCSKSYPSQYSLNEHMLSHGSERNFKCDIEGCGKDFKSWSNLRSHQYLHRDEYLPCDWPGCDYSTKTEWLLSQHKLIHTNQRKYVCDWPECSKRFKTRPHLKNHQRIHNNDKRFVCSWPGCQYSCTDNGNLFKHKKVHLNNN